MTSPPDPSASGGAPQTDPAVVGLFSAMGAFLFWGLVAPVYFKLVSFAGPVEIVSHRIVWTVVLMGIGVLALKGPLAIVREVGSWRRLGIYAVTTLLVSANWTVFIVAVVNGQLVQSSLGYYINPLVNVLLGVVFLHERLSRRQAASTLVAGVGVTILAVSFGEIPWIALALAFSFGFYALMRKKARIDPVIGLVVETALLVPFALVWLLWLGWSGSGAFLTEAWTRDLLLVLAGPVTALPLVLFMIGAQRLKLSTIGLLQYIGPTGQLLLGVLVYGEAFTWAHAAAFACIWVALVLFSSGALAERRAARAAAAAVK